ncbi:hypothetical protein AVI51_04530 [Piscirickettsia salmonis]|uniref:Uncharacterized protein n=1 Tax=Piscirickettsia salmonis TaxID=1238 RepID=A0A9Q6PSV8_PISSA|nr:hypothetical protein [Piscirickettsia salmonis]ALA25374.1 transcriptional regulator, MarR family [Piscirickettsia salmonis]APS45601.1 hypothetical protein AVI48_15280 [Piscirickettsia salmonis]APS46256.1 hypothetical protein AVI49_00500 [Piscirickettsia salmonis]APS50192.1 hypothetical protein AVI50_04580 [Piscirickettsia salmonis]APS53391.1 hypothetical protein AVI51_04530 [Piscirickettsia salmonis]
MPYVEVESRLSKMQKIDEKPGGVTNGFIGIKVNKGEEGELFNKFKDFYLDRYNIDVRDLEITNYYQLIQLFHLDNIKESYKDIKSAFTKYCKENGFAYLVKNDHKDPRISRGVLNQVSNPTKNFRQTGTYTKLSAKGRLGTLAAEAMGYAYNIAKRGYKEDKNKESLEEVFALNLANIIGLGAPQASILVKKYKNGEAKFCVKTHWEPSLIHDQSASKVTAHTRYLAAMLTISDYDMLGSRGQNAAAKLRADGSGTDLYVYDCGHPFSNKAITNIAPFESENDLYTLVGLVNTYLALPKSWLTQSQINILEHIKDYIETIPALNQYIIQNPKSYRQMKEGLTNDIESLDISHDEKLFYKSHIEGLETKLQESFRNTVMSLFKSNKDIVKAIQAAARRKHVKHVKLLNKQLSWQLSTVLQNIHTLGSQGYGQAYHQARESFNSLCAFLNGNDPETAIKLIEHKEKEIPDSQNTPQELKNLKIQLKKLKEILIDPDIHNKYLHTTIQKQYAVEKIRKVIYTKLSNITKSSENIDKLYDQFKELISAYNLAKSQLAHHDITPSAQELFNAELEAIEKNSKPDELNSVNFEQLKEFVKNDFQDLPEHKHVEKLDSSATITTATPKNKERTITLESLPPTRKRASAYSQPDSSNTPLPKEHLKQQVSLQLSSLLQNIHKLGSAEIALSEPYQESQRAFNILCAFLSGNEPKAAVKYIEHKEKEIPDTPGTPQELKNLKVELQKLKGLLTNPDIANANLHVTMQKYYALDTARRNIFAKLSSIVKSSESANNLSEQCKRLIDAYNLAKANLPNNEIIPTAQELFSIELTAIESNSKPEELHSINSARLKRFIQSGFQEHTEKSATDTVSATAPISRKRADAYLHQPCRTSSLMLNAFTNAHHQHADTEMAPAIVVAP